MENVHWRNKLFFYSLTTINAIELFDTIETQDNFDYTLTNTVKCTLYFFFSYIEMQLLLLPIEYIYFFTLSIFIVIIINFNFNQNRFKANIRFFHFNFAQHIFFNYCFY